MKVSVVTFLLGFLFFSCMSQTVDKAQLAGTWVLDKGTSDGKKVFDRSDVNVSIRADMALAKELSGTAPVGTSKEILIANSKERFRLNKGLRYIFTGDSVKIINADGYNFHGTYVIDPEKNTVTCEFIEKDVASTTFTYRDNQLLLITGFMPENEEFVQVYIKSK